eukprot:2238940-Alexandrium_andersonii.AAC.1
MTLARDASHGARAPPQERVERGAENFKARTAGRHGSSGGKTYACCSDPARSQSCWSCARGLGVRP